MSEAREAAPDTVITALDQEADDAVASREDGDTAASSREVGAWLDVPFSRALSEAQARQARAGCRAQEMEDKWHIDFDARTSRLLFTRSWTGQPVFRASVTAAGDGHALSGLQVHAQGLSRVDDLRFVAERFEEVLDYVLLPSSETPRVAALDMADEEHLRLWSLVGKAAFA